jgi:hypothetical protein
MRSVICENVTIFLNSILQDCWHCYFFSFNNSFTLLTGNLSSISTTSNRFNGNSFSPITLRLPCMWYTCHTHHWSQIHTFYKSYQFSHLSPLNPSTFFCIDKFFHQFFPCNYTLFLMILLSARIFELKNTLTTNKLECFYNSYYIYRFTLSATHSGG